MSEKTSQPIEQMVRSFQAKDLSRSGFIAALAGLGATSAGIATVLATAESTAAAGAPPHAPTSHPVTTHNHKKLHHEHVTRQNGASLHAEHLATIGSQQGTAGVGATMAPRVIPAGLAQKLEALLEDYADHAVVTDPLFAEPFVGKAAIRERKLAEMAGMAGLTITVTHRFAHGDEVVAEWVARGTIHGQFLGLAGNGRSIEMHGVTVVTRHAGKVVKEALYYDLAALHRQLG